METKPQVLKTAIDQDAYCLIPYGASDYHSTQITRILYDGLVRKDREGNITPAVAKSYDITPDKKTYTFHLRKTHWSNGDLVTARDFAYTFKKLIDPKSGLPLACDFHTIKNAKKCSEGKAPLDTVGIKIKDDLTLVIELEHPNPYFLFFVASASYLPVHAATDRTLKKAASHPVSNGPFLLESWKPTCSLTLKKNPTYWDAKNVKLDHIQIDVLTDPMTQIHLYDKGELDYIGSPLSMFLDSDTLKERKTSEELHQKETSAVSCLMINTEITPLGNKKLRQALSQSIRRADITNHVLQLGGEPATGFLAGCLSLTKKNLLEENERQAKQLFDEALKELGLTRKTFPTLILSHRNLAESKKVMTAIAEQWKKVLGIEIKLKNNDYKTYMGNLFSGQFQISEVTWNSKVSDPLYVLSFFRGKNLRMNLSNWECPEYCALLTRADKEIDETKRKKLIAQAEEIFLGEMPVIPVYFVLGLWLENPALEGVAVSNLKEIDFKEAHFSSP